MTEQAIEREEKFEVTDDFVMPELGPEFGDITEQAPVKLAARYWDTQDHRLLRWGHRLRFREASDGSEDGWTLKFGVPPGAAANPTGALEREELEEPGSRDSPPDKVLAPIRGIVRRAQLDPIATIETDRRVMVVSGENGTEAGNVEISDDRVTSSLGDSPGPAFRQIEVEAKGPDSDELLAAISGRLIQAGATPTSATKLEKVLGGTREPEVVVPALGRDSSLDVLVRYSLARSVNKLLRNDPKVRTRFDIEAVHDARVATRRLRSDLVTLRPILSPVDKLRDELGWAGGLLGAVRDLDVLIERLEAQARDLTDPDREAFAPILVALRADRQHRRSLLLDGLRSARYLDLVDQLIEACHEPPLRETSDERSARPVLRKVTRKAWRRTARAVDRLGDAPSDAELHEIRKRAKRARYAAELGQGVFGKPAVRFARRLTDVQDTLGALHDTVVAEDRLRSLRLPGDSAFVAGVLVERERQARADVRRQWPGRWKAARRKRLRRWLKR
jgi:CHAD domain-containing protein